MEDILNITQVEPEAILEPVVEGWSFFGLFGDKIKESSSLLTALFIVLVTNIVFATSDSPATKRLMSLVMGLIILGILFSYTICHSLIIAFVVYALNRFLKKRAPPVVLLFTIGYALGYHRYIQEPQHNYNIWGDLYKFSLIPLICKCISFTLCYSDSFKDPSLLSIDQDRRKIAIMPSIYHYFSYIFHYISVFFGPPLDYYDFENFINASGEYTKFERNIKGTFANVSLACLSFLLYVILTCFIDPLIFFNNGLPEDSSLLYQIYMICAVGLVSRIFYYCIATFFQAGIELSGLSYGGIDDIGQMHFGRIKVINRAFILQTDPSATIQSWNPSYYVWLKRYIYVRIASLHSIRQNIVTKCLAIATALAISYILLGFPPGGIIAYIHLFLLILASSYFHKGKWRLAKLPAVIRLFGSSIKWLYLYFAFSVFAIGIQIKDWEAAGAFYKGVGSIMILVELCILGFFFVTGWGNERVKGKEDKPEKTEELEESDIPKIVDETREYIESMRRKIEDQWHSKKTN